eukprot:SM000220S07057  [mRNA]  locus=s220:136633:139696:+ [translate_table: standard]
MADNDERTEYEDHAVDYSDDAGNDGEDADAEDDGKQAGIELADEDAGMAEDDGGPEDDDGRAVEEKRVEEAAGDGAQASAVEAAGGPDEEMKEEEKKAPRSADDPTSQPPHGSEVFVGGITKDTTEADLRAFCSPAGDVYGVRIGKDKESGQNKPFAFVTFTNRESAEKAMATLSESAELKGKKVRVTYSQSKHRIFVGNVPKAWSKEDFEKALKDSNVGVTGIELLQDPNQPDRNRGFAFLEYHNHACAEQSRRNMTKPTFRLDGYTPTVSWAEGKAEPDAAAMAQVKVVYVKNLTETTTEEQLQELFEEFGEVQKVVLPLPKPGQSKRDFGFVHFSERSQALAACEKSHKLELNGKTVEVSLAKPLQDKSRASAGYDSPPQGRPGLLQQGGRSGAYGGGRASYGGGRDGGHHGGYMAAPGPIILGRGSVPMGMVMVPMILPDGRVGYVFQPGDAAPPLMQGGGRGGPMPYGGRGDPILGRRYRPY